MVYSGFMQNIEFRDEEICYQSQGLARLHRLVGFRVCELMVLGYGCKLQHTHWWWQFIQSFISEFRVMACIFLIWGKGPEFQIEVVGIGFGFRLSVLQFKVTEGLSVACMVGFTGVGCSHPAEMVQLAWEFRILLFARSTSYRSCFTISNLCSCTNHNLKFVLEGLVRAGFRFWFY